MTDQTAEIGAVGPDDVAFVRLQGQTEAAAAAASQQAEVIGHLVRHIATLSRDAKSGGSDRKALQQRLAAVQRDVEHLKDDLDATVGQVHVAATQSLQFLSFNKALQGAVDELTAALQDEKRVRLQLEQQLKQVQEQVMQQDVALHHLQQQGKQQQALLLSLQDDQLQQGKSISDHQAQKVSSVRQQHQLLALTRQLDADLHDTQKVLAQEMLGLRQQVKTTLRSQARSQALYSFTKKRTEALQDAVAQQQRDMARLQSKMATAVSSAIRNTALPRVRPAPVPAPKPAADEPEAVSLESSLEALLSFADTLEGPDPAPTNPPARRGAAAGRAAAAAATTFGKGLKTRAAGLKPVAAAAAAAAKAGGSSTTGGGLMVPRSARVSSASRRALSKQPSEIQAMMAADAASRAAEAAQQDLGHTLGLDSALASDASQPVV